LRAGPCSTRPTSSGFFAGLSVEEVADTQGLTTRTVHRDWRRAKAFLYDAVEAGDSA
jgi:DNA-directed RNA polymerase specialized sigma24 family protein